MREREETSRASRVSCGASGRLRGLWKHTRPAPHPLSTVQLQEGQNLQLGGSTEEDEAGAPQQVSSPLGAPYRGWDGGNQKTNHLVRPLIFQVRKLRRQELLCIRQGERCLLH